MTVDNTPQGTENSLEEHIGSAQKIFLLAVAVVFLYIVYRLRLVLLPFALGGMVAYALVPAAKWLREKGMSWKTAVWIVYGTTVFIILLLAGILIPEVVQESRELLENLPAYSEVFLDQLKAIDDFFPRWDLTSTFRSFLVSWTYDIRATLTSALSEVLELFVMMVGFLLLGVVVTPFVLYFFMADVMRIRHALIALFPASRRREFICILREVDQVVGGFIRGRIILSVFVGASAAVGLVIMGIRFPLVIGVVAGIADIIPYLGPVAGAIPALILASLDSVWLVVAVALLFGGINLVEGVFMIPKIMGREVNLHPLTVLLSLLVGGAIYGAFGLIVAVPVAGVAKVLIEHYYRRPLLSLRLLRSREVRNTSGKKPTSR